MATLVRTRASEACSADSICSHMVLSFFSQYCCLRVEALRPAPPGHKIRFIRLEGTGQCSNALFRKSFSKVADCQYMRCGPAKIQGHQRAEQVIAVYCPRAV